MSLLNSLFGKSKKGKPSEGPASQERTPLQPNEEVGSVAMHRRYGEKIINKVVEIDAKGLVGSFRACHFVNCEIKIRCAAKYTFVMTTDCTFDHCLIWAHAKQTGGNWNATFNHCRFKGRYELRFEHKVTNCDFTEAKLSYVEFLENKQSEELQGINYPTVVITNVKANYAAWEQATKPSDYEDLLWTSKRNTGLVALNLEAFTKQPQALWAGIKELPFVEAADAPSDL